MKLSKSAFAIGFLASVLALSACGGGGTVTTTNANANATATAAAECPFGDYKSAVVAQVNAIRSRAKVCGGVAYPAARALSRNGQLESAAAVHSSDMAVNNFFDHPGSNGSRIGARTTAAGYAYKKVGENIAAGQTSASQVAGDWLASASHCSNMMTASFTDVGLSCKTNPNAAYQYYWTLVIANR